VAARPCSPRRRIRQLLVGVTRRCSYHSMW
jgi:hypothetical protein